MDYTEREDALKAQVTAALERDFLIKPEASGRDMVHNEPVRVDFLLWPRQHVVTAGYPRQVAAVEVKWLEDDDIGGLAELCWQGITYQQSVFPDKHGADHRPMFTLLYADSDGDKSPDTDYASAWRWASRILQRANVGFLRVASDGWGFYFGPSRYAGRRRGEFTMSSVANLGTKIYVGNCSNGRGLTTRYALK